MTARRPDEAARLQALHAFCVLDTSPQPEFDELTELAAELCGTSMALVSLIDVDRQWHKSRFGLELETIPREDSFCAHALYNAGELLIVEDTWDDPRFVDNPMVTGPAGIRFYAGAPLVTADGHTLGTLCVADTVPNALTQTQQRRLWALSRQVMSQLQLLKQAGELQREVAERKASELALQNNSRLLDALLAASKSMIFIKDLAGRYLLANGELGRMLGLDDGYLLGRTDGELFGAVGDRYRREDLVVLQTGRRHDSLERIVGDDGAVYHFQNSKFALCAADGQPYALAGVATDVSELTAIRHELAQSVQRWRGLVEWSQTAVAVLDADRTLIYLNPPAERLYRGTSTEPVIGRPAAGFNLAEDAAAVAQMYAKLSAGEIVHELAWRIRRLDGVVISLAVNATAVIFDGQPCVQVELWDTTERTAAAATLLESENRWRSLFAASPVGIGLLDENLEFVAVNDAMCALFGRPEAEVLNRTSAAFTHPADLYFHDQIDGLISAADDGVARLEKRYLRPDGEIRYAWLTVVNTPGPAGQSWKLTHIQDITERWANEQAVAISEANLSAVSQVVKRIQSGADARQTIVDAGRVLAAADSVSLFEPAPGGHQLAVSATTELALLATRIELSTTSAAVHAYRTGEPIMLSDPAENPLVLPQLLQITGARSLYLVPVRSGDTVTAVLLVSWKHRMSDLDHQHTSVVTLLADHAGVALRQAALVSELEELALTDALTGLPNRRSWNQRLDSLLVSARRHRQRLTVALADLDHFKRYNDSFGHPAGDLLLCDFALAADRALRAADTVARWGGEEFALALPDCPEPEASTVLNRVRTSVPRAQTCSIGYATWNGRETAAELMQRADLALYEAKNSGRDRVLAAR